MLAKIQILSNNYRLYRVIQLFVINMLNITSINGLVSLNQTKFVLILNKKGTRWTNVMYKHPATVFARNSITLCWNFAEILRIARDIARKISWIALGIARIFRQIHLNTV